MLDDLLGDHLKSVAILVDAKRKSLCVLDKPSLRRASAEEFGKAVSSDLMRLIVIRALHIWHQKVEDALHG